jgi:hypothetical protein
MNLTRFTAVALFALGTTALAQDPPVPVPPAPPPVPAPAHVNDPLDPNYVAPAPPAPSYDHYDHYTYDHGTYRWAPPSGVGFGLVVGGGITDYISHKANGSVDLGPEWAARFNLGTRSYLGAEAAYVGSTQHIEGLAATNGQLLSNGLEGLVRLNLSTRAIQPYLGAGLGWRRYQVINQTGFASSDVLNRTDVGDVPVAAGVALRTHGFLLDTRFNMGIPFTHTPLLALPSGAQATTWGVNGNLGFEF